jgi:hypothetical protein
LIPNTWLESSFFHVTNPTLAFAHFLGKMALAEVSEILEDLGGKPHLLDRRLGQLSAELPVVPKEGGRHVVVDSTTLAIIVVRLLRAQCFASRLFLEVI